MNKNLTILLDYLNKSDYKEEIAEKIFDYYNTEYSEDYFLFYYENLNLLFEVNIKGKEMIYGSLKEESFTEAMSNWFSEEYWNNEEAYCEFVAELIHEYNGKGNE